MMRIGFITFMSFTLLLASACTGESKSGKEADYDATKKMVLDILQTDDGKKALKEVMTDEEMKKQLIIESDLVKEAIDQVLVSDKGKDMWKKLFEDPAFVESFSTSMVDEQKKLMKDLMNDASFQKQMIQLLQDPEMTKQMLTVLKSQEFRAHLEEITAQTLETPTFQKKIQDILLKAAEEQGKQEGQPSSGKSEAGGKDNKESEGIS